MTPNFRLEIAMPATNVASAFTKIYTQTDQAVQSIDVELKKDKGRVSYLTARIRDPGLVAFAQLPDVAFYDIPVKLYIVEPGKSPSTPVLVFDGKVTMERAAWPQMDIEIVGHDKTIDLRRRALYRSFKNLTSVQILQKIASDYGITVDATNIGDVTLSARSFSIGHPGSGDSAMSDWDHVWRELAADGLSLHWAHHLGKLVVQQISNSIYPQTFRPGDGKVVELKVTINHVRSPGGLGGKSNPVALQNSGTDKALRGTTATEGSKEKGGDARTHQRPVGGAQATNRGAHTEDIRGTRWSNTVTHARGRKDEASLTLNPTPGIYLTHLIPLAGFGGKIDGNWEVVSVKHSIIPGDGQPSETIVDLARGLSHGGAKQTGLVAFGS